VAITEEELNEEQKAQVIKLYWKYFRRCALASFGYAGFFFLATLGIIYANALYVHNEGFQFLTIAGSYIVAIGGWRGTIDEYREDLAVKVQVIVGHL
jgi:uncharacterized membrane protein YesL